MKTIDFLVQELPKCGGWPEGATGAGFICGQGELYFWDKDDCCPSAWILDVWEAIEDTESEISRERYEAALAAKNDGWIEWGGGECPVPRGTLIDVKHLDGEIYQNKPAMGENNVCWSHNGSHGDIIAYRLHKPQEAEQAEADGEVGLSEHIGQDATPVWNGEGVTPPVGCVCERSWAGDEWQSCKILFASGQIVVVKLKESGREGAYNIGDVAFRPTRPIHSEADRKRDEAAQALCNAGGGNGKVDEKAGYGSCWFDVYDAIAAGKIPGVKLED